MQDQPSFAPPTAPKPCLNTAMIARVPDGTYQGSTTLANCKDMNNGQTVGKVLVQLASPNPGIRCDKPGRCDVTTVSGTLETLADGETLEATSECPLGSGSKSAKIILVGPGDTDSATDYFGTDAAPWYCHTVDRTNAASVWSVICKVKYV